MSMNKYSILIVDDDSYIRDMLAERLKLMPYVRYVVLAEDVPDAMRKFNKQDFNLILLDYKLPRLSGIDFVHKLSREIKEKGTQIIFISAFIDQGLAIKLLRFGIRNILVKPFTNNDLSAMIEKVLKIS